MSIYTSSKPTCNTSKSFRHNKQSDPANYIMASQLHIYTPFPSLPATKRISKLSCSKFPCSQKNGRRASPKAVKVFAEKRDNLDNLQRVGNQQQQHQQQSQIKTAQQPASTGVMWDRFPTTTRTVQQMIDTMNRIMDDPFGSSLWPAVSPVQGGDGGYGRGRMPWAIQEGETDYKLRFDMPGMAKSDVKCWVEDNMLVLKGEKVLTDNNNQNGSANDGGDAAADEGWSSKSYGKYSFRIALPENIEFEKIKAEVKDGVLYVTIPKATTTRKVIDIDIE
ncbi:Heat shock protein 21, chloroplastic [Linum grandiflorum]